MGSIGVTLSGIAIYGKSDLRLADAYVNEWMTLNKCGGHPQEQGEYHFHEKPPKGCVFTGKARKHSRLFGIMYDGIPIFGSLGDDGVHPTDLDKWRGYVDKTNPFYHYHLPKNMAFSYNLNCLCGCVFDTNWSRELEYNKSWFDTCPKETTQYDHSAIYKNIPEFIQQYDGTSSSSDSNSSQDKLVSEKYLPASALIFILSWKRLIIILSWISWRVWSPVFAWSRTRNYCWLRF